MPAVCNAKNAIRNECRNDLDRLNNFSLCQFSTLFLAPGEYSVPVWSTLTPGSQLYEKYVFLREIILKKRRLKQLELTDYCSLECPLARDAGVYSSAVARWFWECDGHKSSAVVQQLQSSRGEWSWYHGVLCEGTVPVVRSRTIRVLTLCDLGVKRTRLQVLRRLCVRGWSAEGLNCLTNTSLWLIVIKVCAQSQKKWHDGRLLVLKRQF